MLDLEGVLIAWDMPKIPGNYYPRPHSHYFVDRCKELFDEIYMNTDVPEERAIRIMRELYDIGDVKYWDFNNIKGYYRKINGYEKFKRDILIHVEDTISQDWEKRIKELGHTYISVPCWHPILAKSDKAKNDTELLRALSTIKRIILG